MHVQHVSARMSSIQSLDIAIFSTKIEYPHPGGQRMMKFEIG